MMLSLADVQLIQDKLAELPADVQDKLALAALEALYPGPVLAEQERELLYSLLASKRATYGIAG